MAKPTLLTYLPEARAWTISSRASCGASLSAEPTDTTEEDRTAEDTNAEHRTKFTVAVQFTSTDPAEPFFDLDKYSRLKTVIRLTARVKRFVNNARSSQKTH